MNDALTRGLATHAEGEEVAAAEGGASTTTAPWAKRGLTTSSKVYGPSANSELARTIRLTSYHALNPQFRSNSDTTSWYLLRPLALGGITEPPQEVVFVRW